jgi:ABC-type Fe3+/spermidine/putrescine transport system ATPase subunit
MLTIQLDSVSKRFGPTAAVDDASLTVRRGEFVALLGPSGCGKTTLLRLIAGFEAPDAGEIRIGGDRVTGSAWRPPEGRHVGMVFQDYALFPHLTVADNVAFGLDGRRAARRERAAAALELVGLDGVQARRYPHELSGGQQQRAALARALAPEPTIVLLDEPWSSVDPVMRATVRDEMVEVVRAAGTTVLMVTHDQEEALGLADRVAVMREGRIVQVDPPERLYYRPADRWAAEFVGAANFLDGRLAAGRAVTPLGVLEPPTAPAGADGACEVLVRPELIQLEPSPAGHGLVVGREFRGHDVMYRVRLDDGTGLWSQRPSNEIVALGARVRVTLHEGPIAVFR